MHIAKFFRDMQNRAAENRRVSAQVANFNPRKERNQMIDRYGTVMQKIEGESDDAFNVRKLLEKEHMNARYGSLSKPGTHTTESGAVYVDGMLAIAGTSDEVFTDALTASPEPYTHKLIIIRSNGDRKELFAYSAEQARLDFKIATSVPFIYASIRKLENGQ